MHAAIITPPRALTAMNLSPVDWMIVAGYFALSMGVGLYFTRRGGTSLNEYFLSGRDVPWWLAGTSMVAATFAADTPLAVTGMVAVGGVAGNWLWWCFAASGMLTVFFYARLWRRSGVMTDIEFAEIRYAGKPAAFLRGFRALYLGIPINCIILGWVNKAMVDILTLTLGVRYEYSSPKLDTQGRNFSIIPGEPMWCFKVSFTAPIYLIPNCQKLFGSHIIRV